MIDRKLCVDCGERPQTKERKRCYACNCAANPEWAERKRERQRRWGRSKYRDNPEWAERQRERQREKYRTNPEVVKRQRERQRSLGFMFYRQRYVRLKELERGEAKLRKVGML